VARVVEVRDAQRIQLAAHRAHAVAVAGAFVCAPTPSMTSTATYSNAKQLWLGYTSAMDVEAS
jgi:hypothetical protein